MVLKNLPVLAVCLFLGWGLLSCGLQDVPYIGRVEDPVQTDLSGTSIRLPSSGEEGYGSLDPFTHFVIFYRIYLSNVFHPTIAIDTSPAVLGPINTQMNTNFSTIFPWADPTNTAVNTAGVQNFFLNTVLFLPLQLEGATIGGRNGVLGQGSLGRTLQIDFLDEPGRRPRLWLDGTYYYLRRAEESQRFPEVNPQPEFTGGALPFFNHEDLRAQRREDLNADVAPVNIGSLHSYVMMYIAATGASGVPPTAVFSQPTFLGIFRLPASL